MGDGPAKTEDPDNRPGPTVPTSLAGGKAPRTPSMNTRPPSPSRGKNRRPNTSFPPKAWRYPPPRFIQTRALGGVNGGIPLLAVQHHPCLLFFFRLAAP